MSKLKRKPEQEWPGLEVNANELASQAFAEEAVQQIAADKQLDLAKVAVSEQTPLCPFCKSVKVEELKNNAFAFWKWKCNACDRIFRAPTTTKAERLRTA